jgi:hypothetical protein
MRVAPRRRGFFEMGRELFVDIAVETIPAKHVCDARPQ